MASSRSASQALKVAAIPAPEATPARKSSAANTRTRVPKKAPASKALAAARARVRMNLAAGDYEAVEYHKNIDAFVLDVSSAQPMTLVETERKGVSSRFVKELPGRMGLPATRLYSMMGIPKATVEKKAAANETLTGMGGKSALGMARLLGIARAIVANSTAAGARDFDSAAWLGQWLDREQPALGGRKPGDLIDTPTGVDVVARLLGALESGAYQ